MLRSDIQTATRQFLNEINDTTYITAAVLVDAVKHTASELNAETKMNKADATVSIYSGARERTMAGTILEVYEARLGTGTDRVKLDPTDRYALIRDDGDWEAGTAGTPTEFYTDGMLIGFNPKPRTRSAWAISTYYATGAHIKPTTDNGFTYKVNTAGISYTVEPTWPTTIDGKVIESGGPTWQQDGHTWVYLRSLLEPRTLTVGSIPYWLPRRYHITIAKGAAVEITRGFSAEDAASSPRFNAIYQEYLKETDKVRALASHRSIAQIPRITVTGYGTFRR